MISWLYGCLLFFYDWPFLHLCTLQRAYVILWINSWLILCEYAVLLWACSKISVLLLSEHDIICVYMCLSYTTVG